MKNRQDMIDGLAVVIAWVILPAIFIAIRLAG